MILPSKYLLPTQLSLLLAIELLSGCAANSARPGEVCGHCDYRFSHYTPNPCDPCVPEIELPGYGHSPTSWQVWPEEVVHSHLGPGQHARPLEEVPRPQSPPPPPTGSMLQPPNVPVEAMLMPDHNRPRALLR